MTGGPAPETPPRRDAARDLLARLTRPEDDEYETAAARDGVRAAGRPGLALFGAAVAALTVLVTVSALQTQAGAPQAERDREGLLAGIRSEQASLAEARTETERLAVDVESLRAAAVSATAQVADLETRLDDLGATVGAAAVSGPGIQVTVDDADSGAAEGRILDSDLQVLVNGLWRAGAEAIAVNGQRLTTLTAIRTAGEAITVNYRSLSPPYVLSVIGDPDDLPARLLETDAGQSFADLEANFGVDFEVETRADLALPAATRLTVQEAAAVGDQGGARPEGGVS